MNWSIRLYIVMTAIAIVPVPTLTLLGLTTPPSLWLIAPFGLIGWTVAHWIVKPMVESYDVARRLRDGSWQARPSERLPEPWQTVIGATTDLADQLTSVSEHMERQVGRRTAQLERKAGQLRALGQIGRQVAAVREPAALLHYVVRLMRGTFGYDLVAVVQHYETHLIVAACAMRGEAEPPVGRAFAANDPSARSLFHVIDTDGVAPSPETEPIRLVDHWTPRAELIAPIRHGHRRLGALIVQSASSDGFDDEDIFTANTIAGQVAVALENSRLFESERQLRRLAVTEERNRIAREIHDTLAQGFMGILIHLRAMQGAADEGTAAVHRREAEALAQESLQEARRSVWNLRPARLRERGLAAALEDELDRLQRQSGVVTALQITGDAEGESTLSAETAATLLRVGQESLHNVLKHARASKVIVTLHVGSAGPVRDETPEERGAESAVELTVQDDGIGFTYPSPTTANSSAFGLIGMRERVEAAGGTLHIYTGPGRGTTVRARIMGSSAKSGPA